MNLAEFVEETLLEILTGIRAAQKREGSGDVGAAFVAAAGHPVVSNIFNGGRHNFTSVDFDVSVAAETTGGGKAGIRVVSVFGVEGGAERKSQETSRVKFSIPLRISESSRALVG